MAFAHGFTSAVERPTGVDRFGNPLAPTNHTVDDCRRYPAGSSEDNHLGTVVDWDVDLFAPYDADFAPEDVVLLPGDSTRYRVHGVTQRWKNHFTGREACSVTRLKAVA